MTDDRRQNTEDRRQKTEDRRQKMTDDRRQRQNRDRDLDKDIDRDTETDTDTDTETETEADRPPDQPTDSCEVRPPGRSPLAGQAFNALFLNLPTDWLRTMYVVVFGLPAHLHGLKVPRNPPHALLRLHTLSRTLRRRRGAESSTHLSPLCIVSGLWRLHKKALSTRAYFCALLLFFFGVDLVFLRNVDILV
jgi:hypothetical protein